MSDTQQFSIRRATAADVAGILACLGSAFAPFRAQYTPDAYADTVLNEQTIRRRMMSMSVFVAVAAGGQIVGTIGCQALSSEEGHLRGMAVRPESQGQSVSTQLLNAAESELRKKKCARITLDTTEPLERAMHFYEKNGYQRSGKVTDFFGMPLFEYAKILAE
jgi:ribosomal protein S18 acetylase RimI-like enzyme